MSASFEVAMGGATAMALAATTPQVNSGMRGGISVLREVMRCSGAQQPAVLEDEREMITREVGLTCGIIISVCLG